MKTFKTYFDEVKKKKEKKQPKKKQKKSIEKFKRKGSDSYNLMFDE